MTHKELFGEARWIIGDASADALLFRRKIEVENPENAEITICGLGYFTLFINGIRVGTDEFVPPYSDYHDRPDMYLSYPLNDDWNHRIYCMKYDLSSYLKKGENILSAMVGSGFYRQTYRKGEGNVSYGSVKLCYSLSAGEEIFISDRETQWSNGFFKKCSLFTGEIQDFTGFDRNWKTCVSDSEGWNACREVTSPKSEYMLADCPLDKVQAIVTPTVVKKFDDYTVYAIEKNSTGYPVIFCDKAGETVEVECTEEIYEDGSIDNTSVGYGHQRQQFTFITDNQTIYHPYFSWCGFRYFSVTNNASVREVRIIHTDVPVTSSFECSDVTLNWLHDTFIQTQNCNMHGSIPSDCPHRERLGYTGDGQLTCDAVMTQYDAKAFYEKWIQDICDCQDPFTGHVQHTAPFAGGGGGPAGWGGAMIVVPYTFYRHYGDMTFLRDMYPRMQKFAEYMFNHSENGLVVREENHGWCLGDWCTPTKIKIPEPLVNSCLFIDQLRMMVYCGKVLGEDVSLYEAKIQEYQNGVIEKYYDAKTGDFSEDIQGANAFAVFAGIHVDRTLPKVVSKYEKLGEFDTGIFGTYILLSVLYSNGYGDLATELLSNKKEVSFEHMRLQGATTIWENWNGESSHNHPMFGASTAYLYSYILGIRQTEDSTAYRKVRICPTFPKSLQYAKGSLMTPLGEISVSWKRGNGKIAVVISAPEEMNVEFSDGQNSIPVSEKLEITI